MGQYEKLEIINREQVGSQVAKILRKEGKIPANFYYSGEENLNLAIDKKVFRKAIHTGQHVFEVELNSKTQYVMIKEVQYHPVTDEIIHIDLMRVRRDVKMTLSVPIILEGTASGVKEGGILTQNLTTLEISCLPSDVPDHIVVDVSEFEMNHVMNVGEIKVEDNIEIITSADMDVLAVIPPKEESLEPEIPTDEEMAEVDGATEEEAASETTEDDDASIEEGKENVNE